MNKRRANRVLYLTTATVVVLYFTQWFYNRTMSSIKTDNTIGKINAVMEHKLDASLTVWGASTALLNINSKLISDSLKISAFNMGINGTNIDQYNGLLKEFINYTKESRFLIIALDIFGGLEKRTEFYELHNWLHHIDNDNIYNCMSDINHYAMIKARYIPFYKISLYSKHSFPYFREALINNYDKYEFPSLGFMPEDIIMDTAQNKIDTLNVPIDSNVFSKLKSSCIHAIQHNIQPIIIITPCYYSTLDKIKNLNEYMTLINSLQKEKVLVFDFSNTEISKDYTNYKNNSHLNSKGADKLTNLLIKEMKIRFINE